jgi:hypothetical protein
VREPAPGCPRCLHAAGETCGERGTLSLRRYAVLQLCTAVALALTLPSQFRFVGANARLQPQAARTVRIEHDARIEGAPTVGCEPWLDSTI